MGSPGGIPRRFAAVSLLAASVVLAGCGAGGDKQRIVLITLDTLRFDSFAGVGGRETSMPLTRAFVAQGERFDRFYSASASTQPSHASLFTGLHPWQHGVVRNGTVLRPRHSTLAEELERSGFGTAAVVASFALHSRFGYDQGFDRFDDDFELELETGQTTWMGKKLEGEFYSLADDVTNRALLALDELEETDRQFLWVHYYDPHTPYGDSTDAPVDLSEMRAAIRQNPSVQARAIAHGRGLYDRDVEYLDRFLGRLLERLEADAGRIETHVVFVSDHGESFGEANSLGHGNRLTPEQIHVPLAIVSPVRPETGDGSNGAGEAKTRTDVSGTVDLFSTLLALAGLAPTSEAHGRDLLATSAGHAYGMRRVPAKGSVREARADGTTGTIEGPRFFVADEDGILSGDAELVLRDDETEAELSPERLREVQLLFGAFQAELEGGDVDALEDEETLEALRAMGYVE